jgi:hypothetical protein
LDRKLKRICAARCLEVWSNEMPPMLQPGMNTGEGARHLESWRCQRQIAAWLTKHEMRVQIPLGGEGCLVAAAWKDTRREWRSLPSVAEGWFISPRIKRAETANSKRAGTQARPAIRLNGLTERLNGGGER